MFLIVEPIIGQAVEPWLYGHNTGISPIAVVISATFWWWLWGTVGLVLSTPLTVCLVVLGRHVERLAFLDVIFGDAPPLTPVENFYQRMLAGDASEVSDQAEQFLETNSLIDYYDEVALQALLMAQVDLRRGVLDEPRQRQIKETIDEVIEDLSDHVDQPPAAAPAPEAASTNAVLKSDGSLLPNEPGSGETAPPNTRRVGLAPGHESRKPVLCIAGRSLLDEAAAALFAQILEKHATRTKIEPAGALTAGRISRLSNDGAQLVCLSYLDADLSMAGTRLAVRRLRRRLPEAKILAGFWQSGPGQASELCAATKAVSAQRDLGTRSTFVSRGRRPKHSRMKSRCLRSKLCPERDDLVEHTQPSGHRPADVARVRKRLRAEVFALVHVEEGLLQAGNAKGACQTAFNPGIDSTREPRRSPRHGVQEAGGG